jgi:hypothetical protein
MFWEIPRLQAEELDLAWYSKKEIRRLRDSIMETVNLMTSETLLDENDEQHCKRGLECQTLRGACERAASKHDTKTDVFQEQERQRRRELYSEEALAQASWAISARYVKDGVKTGLRDQLAVQPYLNENPKSSKRSILKSLSFIRLHLIKAGRANKIPLKGKQWSTTVNHQPVHV